MKSSIFRGAKLKILVAPCEDMSRDELPKMKEMMLQLPDSYEKLLQRHQEVHRSIFQRVNLDLQGYEEQVYTNEELIQKVQKGEIPVTLAQRMHDFGRYLLICSAGDLPPNAQGIWNGSWRASGLVDYVMNIELEMAVWPALQGNMPECLEGYFGYIESLIPDWKDNAIKLYGCRGVLASSRSSNHGLLHHFSLEYPHMFWTAGAGWMAQTFYEYWLYTGDSEFLRVFAIPLMKEVALFYEDFLVEGDDGKYAFIPSLSPENTPENIDSQASINATLDIAVARELLSNLLQACEGLKVEQAHIERWKILLEKLPYYQVNIDGSLKEWAHKDLEDNYPHRHISHLYPVMPGLEADKKNAKELFKAYEMALKMRLENGLLKMCGWSLGHAANAAARLKDGELAWQILSEILKNYVKINLFTTLVNGGQYFQVDANFGFTAAVMEMLVYSRPGLVELIPALPTAWRKGRVEGVYVAAEQ